MHERLDCWIDNLWDYGPFLPLRLSNRSRYRLIRVGGLLWFFVWVFPSLLVIGIPFLGLLYFEMFVDAWKGQPHA